MPNGAEMIARARSLAPVLAARAAQCETLRRCPDETIADNPAAKLYKYTMVENEVVLVDPTKMRIVDKIGPAADR